VSITSFHTSPKSFREAQYGFVDRVLSLPWQLVPYQLQNFLELIDVLRLGLKWLVARLDGWGQASSEAIHLYQWIQWIIGSNPVLSQLCRVCRRAVLFQGEARWQNRSAILNKFWQQDFNRKFGIPFGLVWNEMQYFLPSERDARRNGLFRAELKMWHRIFI